MAKTKKKKGILEHLGFSPAEYPYEDDEEDNATKQKPDDISALKEQIAELKGMVEASSKRDDDPMLYAFMDTNRGQQQQQTQQPNMNVDFSNLPDPVMEPEDYHKEVLKRTQKAMADYAQAVQQNNTIAQNRNNQVDQLWDDFSDAYEDYADDPKKVEFAATEVAQNLQSRGVDVEKYMFNRRDKFFAEVVKQMDKVFGKVDAANETDDDDTVDDEPSRTAGVFGGLESGGRPTKTQDNDPGDMIKDIHDLQRKSGFF